MLTRKLSVSKEAPRDYKVTLCLETKAVPGYKFYHGNVPVKCNSCQLFQICMGNLTIGHHYVIKEVKEDMSHECPNNLFEGNLIVVKVIEQPVLVSFPARLTFEGMNIKFHPQPCPEEKCQYYSNCNPPLHLVKMGETVKCIKIIKKLKNECKFKHDLSLLEVKRIET